MGRDDSDVLGRLVPRLLSRGLRAGGLAQSFRNFRRLANRSVDETASLNSGGYLGRIVLRLLLIWGCAAGSIGLCFDGPGGPILVATHDTNAFTKYYSEILLAEGLNEFSVTNLASVSSDTLTNFDVVILGEMSLTPTQVVMLSDWVNGGGRLIAMRPDKQLAELLGLVDDGGTLVEGYVLVNTTNGPGVGIVGETMQFHGSADRYTLGGATQIAMLYSNATAATANPAVTIRNVGGYGGMAAAFTYDLAKSVIWTRQGNPAWAGQERDGLVPTRPNDLFFGNAAGDPQPDWVDFDKIAIPQADEQQRLLANLIIQMNADRKLLPRFWYFPDEHKAVVVMTGDDHAYNGTTPRFDQYLAFSGTNTLVDDWKTIRGTSYIFPGTISAPTPLTDAQAAAYEAAGFEVALHCTSSCATFTSPELDNFLSSQLQQLAANYPSLSPPATLRMHCIAWCGYTIVPEVARSHGIRLDTTYYYFPANWVSNRVGMFTGSGMVMRFATTNGSLIDVYQAATQMTDESAQPYPFTSNVLLDRAVGKEAYYGFFVANMHTDFNTPSTPGRLGSDGIVASALRRGVPVVTASQLLTWVEGRNSSSLLTLNSSTNSETFSVQVSNGARGLQVMMPVRMGYSVSGVTFEGVSKSFNMREVKGMRYAVFAAQTGNFMVNFVPDTNAPVVLGVEPANGAVGVNMAGLIKVRFSEGMDPSTITNGIVLSNAVTGVVAGTILYHGATNTAEFVPANRLLPSTSYTVLISGGTGGVKDVAGNPLAGDVTASFTTTNQAFYSIWQDTMVPILPEADDTVPVQVGVKFRSDVSGYVTGIRFYKSPGNTGPHVGNLWTANGTLIGSVVFQNETTSGWQYQPLTNPVAILSNTTYVASYHTTVGRYSAEAGYFAAAGEVRPPLRALADGEDGVNGVFAYGDSGTFPTETFNAPNYWVDVVFTDNLPPAVSGVIPADGAEDVGVDTAVMVTFNEMMDESTVTNNIVLSNLAGGVVPSMVIYHGATNTVELIPVDPLAHASGYTLLVVGGAGGAKDLAGGELSADFTASFTTVGLAQSIWSSSETPDILSDEDQNPVEVGLKFRSAVNGYVTGIRFFKGESNLGPHVGNLWTGDGNLLASNTFTNETTSGWQYQALTNPVAITSNTTYVVSYHAPGGRYSLSSGYFTTAGVTNFPLWALADGEDGPNGIYGYGPSSFPTQTFNGSHYWVDVVFAESLESETNYPTATNMTVELLEDTVESITLLGGGGQVSYAVLTSPTNGNLGVLDTNTGVVSYTPHLNYHGTDLFQFTVNGYGQQATGTVSLTIVSVNDAPQATNMAVALPENSSTNLSLLGGDIESVVTFGILNGPTNGMLTDFNQDTGMVLYTPATGYVGGDVFSFTVNDGNLSATGLVTLTVISVNVPPVAVDDAYNVGSETTLEIAAPGVLDNDTDADGDNLTALLVSGPFQGVLSLSTNGGFNYVPTNHFAGMDTFTYQVSDGLSSDGPAVVSLMVSNRIQITSFILSNQVAELSWTSILGRSYRLQFKADLAETDWMDLSPVITATGAVTSGTNAIGVTPGGFYRVLCVGN